MKFISKSVIALLLFALAANSAFAQNYPMPGSASSAPVICTGCVGNNASGEPNAGKPTYPYRSPIVAHVGRFVDSYATGSVQHVGFRTARSGRVRIAPGTRGAAPGRAYMAIGEAVGAYSLSTLFSSVLPSPLEPVTKISTGAKYGSRSPYETVQLFDMFIYPEATSSGWEWTLMDIQKTLGDFDFDDRGLVYAAFRPYGWGIAQDTGATGGTHMPKVSQIFSDTDSAHPQRPQIIPSPEHLLSLHVGSKYYAIVSDATGTAQKRWDVTNPASPVVSAYVEGRGNGFRAWAKNDTYQRLALIDGNGEIHIYSYSDFVNGSGAIASFAAGSNKEFIDLAINDDGTVWAVESDGKTNNQLIYKFTPAGSTYTKQSFDAYGRRFNPKYMAVGGGYLAISGTGTIFSGSSGYDIALFRIQDGTPVLVDTDGFFGKYYHTAPSGYAQASGGSYTNFLNGIALYKYEGKVYLFYSPNGLGDVYELEGSDSISVQMKTASFGTVNPNSKATESGPFTGDTVTFNTKSSNSAVTYSVDVDFGNPETGDNLKAVNTGVDVKHQYSGFTSAAQITAPKVVQATVRSDASISATLPVSLKVPAARIGFPTGPSTWTAITTDTTERLAVAGQVFTDASDGSVEGHFGTWTIDGVASAMKPNGTLSVGGIGRHTVKLTGSYGRYDTTTYAITAPFNTSTATVPYQVVPFTAYMNAPVKSGSNIVFSGVGAYTNDSSVLTATEWTVTWNLTAPTGASALATQGSTVAIGTIPNFVVPSPITPNSTITLTVSVDPSKLGTSAQNYGTATDTQILSTPDPKFVMTGCAHAGDPCTFTASSISNASTSGWTYEWTLKSGGNVVTTGTTNPFTPSISAAGTYNVQLKVVKTVFEATSNGANFDVGAPLCGPLPSSDSVSISSTCSNGCDVNEEVTFIASAIGYSFQDCDSVSWNFGDSTTGSGRRVTHKFTTKKTYTVKMTLKNTANPTGITVENTYTVGGSTPPPPPPPVDTCLAPTGIAFTYSGNQGCSPTVACKVGEAITFTPLRGASSLLACDTAAWDFGDSHTSGSKTAARNTYDTTGTFIVSLTVANELGTSTPVTKSLTIAPAAPTGCSATPTAETLYVRYEGATSGCRDSNAVVCQKGENITFRIGTFGYTVQSCDTVQWTFGDGGTSTSQSPVHAYTASGNSFVASLKVTNTNGTATVSDTIPFGQVTNQEPSPTLTYDSFPTTGQTNKPVTFKVNSNLSATGWTWTFGDNTADDTSQAGTTATTRTITHTFTKAGTFSVRVTARNSAGAATDNPGAVLSQITITNAPAEPEYKYLLPVVTHIGGQNGSSWRTDVQIYSQDPTITPSKPLTMTALLRDISRTLQIPSSTYIYEDFMRTFTNGNDSGPVVITVKGQYAPQIWTRTYNQTEAGTFGQFIPAIRIDDAGAGSSFGDGKYYLAGLRNGDRYRTNLGLVNANPNSVNVAIRVYDNEGVPLGSFTRTLASFQLDQFAITAPGAIPDLPKDRPFSVEIEVPSGQWLLAYASYIDGGSNDPVFIQATRESELASADYRSLVLPGVGHVGDWRSDVTVFNPNGRKINVDLTYHDGTGAQTGQALSVPIGAGEFLQYSDLLRQGVFGSVGDSVGVLRITVPDSITADHFPLALARTYNDAGNGKTYGQGIAAFATARANVKPNKPALIPAVRDNTKFYTNLGLTNTTGTAVTVTVKLLDPSSGSEVRSAQYNLNPYQSVVGRFVLDGRDNASLKIEATGNVWAFASIIDKSTFDPEYVPATPLQ